VDRAVPGAMFDLGNRDGDGAIHLELGFKLQAEFDA